MATDPMWDMFRNKLIDYVTGGVPANVGALQLVTTPLPLDWANPVTGRFLSWYTFANLSPGWTSNYQPSSGRAIDQEYGTFLSSIAIPMPDSTLENQLNDIQESLDTLQDSIFALEDQMMNAWNTFQETQKDIPKDRRKSYDTWYSERWADRISRRKAQYRAKSTEFASIINQYNPGYQEVSAAITDFANDAPPFKEEVTNPNGSKINLHSWFFSQDLSNFISEAQAGLGTEVAFSIDRTSSTNNYTYWEAGGGVDINVGFVSVGAEGGASRLTVDSTSQDFETTFSFKSFNSIQVVAGPWFHQNVVTQFQQGPWIPNSPIARTGTPFFGPTGTFNLIPNFAHVVYQPSITIKADNSSFNSIKSAWDAGGQVSIGPVSFGGRGNRVDYSSQFNSVSKTITIESKSLRPQLIAVSCNIMPQ